MLKKFDKFILKAFIGPFFAILLVVVFILVMQFLWLYIDELVGKGLGFKVVAEFLMWGSCTILPLALPLATLLASMMTMGQLSENNELLAIKSAGISLSRVIAPLITASLLISIGAYFTANNLVPYSFNQIFTLRDDIGKTKEEIKIPSGTFYDGIDGYILRVEDSEGENGMMYGIMVYDHTGHLGNTSVTLADSAIIKLSKSKDYLTFTMFDGANYQEANRYDFQDTSRQLQRINFIRQEMVIPLNNYAFKKSDDARYGSQTKSQNIKQLRHVKDSLDFVADSLHTKHVSDMMATSSLIFIKQLDSAARAKGKSPIDLSLMEEWKSDFERIAAHGRAAEEVKKLISEMETYERETYDCTYTLRRTDLQILKKYSGALACLLLFFIGAPLGALIRKGGLGTPAIISALFFVLYWVVDISGEKLAKDGAIDAGTGAFISAYILAPIGLFLTWKAINDAALFNSDGTKIRWRKIKNKIMGLFKKTRIVYMGTPEFAVAPLDALISKGYDVVGVVTVADKPSGRGLKVNESAVKQYAVSHNIPVLQPVKLKDPEFLKQLADWKADLFVVVAFRMLPEEVWAMPRLGTFNLHAALLPQYRGAAPINWAVINGERQTGVTTFMLDKDIDTGAILLREECRISETDNAGDIHDRLMTMGAELVTESVQGIIEGNIETRVQRSFIQGSEVLKPAPKITKELCHIDWNDTTRNIYNLIRGLSPYPGAFTELVTPAGGEGEEPVRTQLKIFSAERVADGITAAPGTVLSDGKTYIHIATADGAISIKELQLAGKKRMNVHDFLLGFRDPQKYSTSEGTSRSICLKIKNS